MNRYMYIVTRIVTGEREGTTNIPNLGMHTSFKSAEKHFDSVISNREQYGNEVLWVRMFSDFFHMPGNTERVAVVKEAYIKERNGERETLRLEKWKI